MEKSKWDDPAYAAGWRAGMWTDRNAEKPKNPYLPYAPQYAAWEKGYWDGVSNWEMNMDDGG